MEITVFQALTFLASQYSNRKDKAKEYKQILDLILVGVNSPKDKATLSSLLQSPELAKFQVNYDPRAKGGDIANKELINNDPSRRYFESMLCHETLKSGLSDLDMKKLYSHYRKAYEKIPTHLRLIIPRTIYHSTVDGIAAKKSDTAPEYISAINLLREDDSFWSMKLDISDPIKAHKQLIEHKTKMLLLVKTAFSAMTAVSENKPNAFPLNLYGVPGYVYSSNQRGRVNRTDENKSPQVTKSPNMGIMRSYMPVPANDPLRAASPSPYVRPVDKSKYKEGAVIPEDQFENQVTPFVNSISGTMLCQLRVCAQLMQEKKFAYADNPDQLKAFFRSLVSYMIYNSGGHSLNEFMGVFGLPEVQEMFKAVPGFDEINLKSLFQETNNNAFVSALEKTIEYNGQLLKRGLVNKEIRHHAGVEALKPTEQGSRKVVINSPATKRVLNEPPENRYKRDIQADVAEKEKRKNARVKKQ